MMMSRKSFLNLVSIWILLIPLQGCHQAKTGAYVDTKIRVIRVLSKVLNIDEKLIVPTKTMSQLGVISGKNDEQIKTALEEEFKIEMQGTLLKPNITVYDLCKQIGGFRALYQPAFGPVRSQPKPSSSGLDVQKDSVPQVESEKNDSES